MTSAWIQYILLDWVEEKLGGKGGIKGGRRKPLNLPFSKSILLLEMFFRQSSCKLLIAFIWYNILHQSQAYIGSYQ